ncbi:MAG: IS21-like element helper ATPase IstB [Clostridiales bacterium]|nr:IS21-like element helper ATPase IstB [Clostridiales bacterium]
MLIENTVTKLYEMKLSVMAQKFKDQLSDNALANLSFEDRVSLIVDAEWAARKSNRMARLIKNADFAITGASIEDIDYRPARKLDKSQILRLSTGNYILEAHNILLLGAAGAGKTYLACAFGVAACRNYYTVRYIRLPDLLTELAMARAENNFREVIRQYRKIKLLILDEWLLYSLKETEARDLLEIVEARHRIASTIFCSQFDPQGWHLKIGESTLADAVCDRIAHNSYGITIEGESMRKMNGIQE